jgi:hypothetical protein
LREWRGHRCDHRVRSPLARCRSIFFPPRARCLGARCQHRGPSRESPKRKPREAEAVPAARAPMSLKRRATRSRLVEQARAAPVRWASPDLARANPVARALQHRFRSQHSARPLPTHYEPHAAPQ